MSKVSCINTTANLDKRDVKTFKADIKSGAKPEDVVEILISDALAEHESLLEIIRSKGGVVEGYVAPVEELKPVEAVKPEEAAPTEEKTAAPVGKTSGQPITKDERALLDKDMLDNEELRADSFRYSAFARRLNAAERGMPEETEWAREWLAEINKEKADFVKTRKAQKQLDQDKEKSRQEKIAEDVALFRDGFIPANTSNKYAAWVKSLPTKDRKELFGEGRSFEVRNARFMGWASAHNEDGTPRTSKQKPTAPVDEILNKKPSKSSTKNTEEGNDALFSRDYKKTPAKSTVAQIESELSVAIKRLSQAIQQRVEIVQTTNGLPIDVPSDVKGMYYQGTAYIVADNTAVSNAKTVLTHEVVGHMGLEELLGDTFSDVLGKIKRMKRVGNKQVTEIVKTLKRNYVDENRNYALTPNQEAREILAHIAETDHNHSLVKQIIAKLKLWLARMGLANKDSAEVGHLIAQAARYVEGKGGNLIVDGKGKIAPSFAMPDTFSTFFSGMARALDGKLSQTVSPNQLAMQLQSPSIRGKWGVKEEEVEWTGVIEWLKEQKGKISKQEVLDFIESNQVQIDETSLATVYRVVTSSNDIEYIKREEEAQKLIDGELEWVEKESSYIDIDKDEGLVQVIDHDSNVLFSGARGEGGEWLYGEDHLDDDFKTIGSYEDVIAAAEEEAQDVKDHYLGYMTTELVADEDSGEKYSDYTVPGNAENYTELLLTLPAKNNSETYQSSHFDEENILAHVRYDERTDEEGNRVLFINEVQSDWHQDGRKEGYSGTGVPNAPFKGNAWVMLAMKRMIRHAAENNFDKVAWATGEQSADLYSLDKQIDELKIFNHGDGFWDVSGDTINNGAIDIATRISEEKLADTIGKEMANKVVESQPEKGLRTYSGVDLKVGGEGMRGFYDKALPNLVNKYIKKWGAKVGTVNLTNPQHGFDVTEKMRESAMKGQPLFAKPVSRNGELFSRDDTSTEAHARAQRNAALPVSEGGLGLPADNTAMDRAKAMGFDVDTTWYHGTGRQFSSFDPKAEGEFSSIDTNNVVTFTTDENIAKRYAKESAVSEKQWDDELNRYIKNGNPRIVEAYLPSNIKNIDAIGRHHDSKWMIGEQEKARNQGFDGVRFNGLADDVYYNPLAGASDITQIFDPSNIRSVNAAFDPMEKDSAELLFSRGDGNWKDDSTGFAIPDETWKTVAIRKLQDKFKVLKDLQANIIESGGEISEEANAYIAEELFHGKAENDIAIMRDEFVAPMAEKMAESGITQAQLDKYLYALHAEERNDHIASINPDMPDGGSGMKTSKAKKIIADIEQGGKAADYKDLAGIVHAMLRERRRVIIDGGLEDDGLIDAWEDKYKNYVPLKGFAENELDDSRPKTGQGFNIGGKESKRALGRGSEAASPSSFAIIDLTETLVRNRKNEVGNALLKLIEDNPQESYWASYTEDNPDTDRRIVKVDGKDVVKETVIPMALMKDQYFTTKRNGKTHYMKLEDPRLMDAMKNLGVDHGGTVIKTMGNITRIMSALNTSYSPEFITGNFLRDVQTAVLNLKAEQTAGSGKINGEEIVSQTVKDIPLAMRSVYASLSGKKMKGDEGKEFQQWFEEFKKAGAKTGWFDMKDLDGQVKEVEQLVEMASGTTKGNALKWAKSAAGVVENMNSAVENAVRLSAYVNARRAGISEQKAASLAKNMTVNFNRKGEVGATLNALFMFSNASIQGVANFARTMGTLKGDKSLKWGNLNNAQKIGVGMAAGAFFIAMANRSAAGEDDDGVNWFDKVPDYVKERNIVIMKSLFGGEQDGTYWKIPLPYGYNIFNVLGDSMESAAFSDKSIANTAGRLTLATLGSFSPIGFQDSNTVMGGVLKNATPTVFKPITDIALNENFFGSSIYNENFPFGTPKPDSAMARRSTPEGYRKVAEWLNAGTGGSEYRSGAIDINPDVMRYVADYFGGAAYGFFGSKIPDVVHRALNGVDVEVNRIPFASRLSGRVMQYDDVGVFYDRRDEINQLRAEYKSLDDGERAGFYKEHGGKMRLSSKIKSAEKRLKLLRKQRDKVYANEDLNFAQRDERLKDIQGKMKKVIDDVNKNYNNALTKSFN